MLPISGFFSKFKNAGKNIVTNIANGITGAIGKVTGAIGKVTQKIRDFLPFSPPKDRSSPLADIHKNGIGEQVAKGIDGGELEVRKAMDHLLQVPDMNKYVPQFGAAGENLARNVTNTNRTITNDNGINIHIENFNSENEDDVSRFAEELAWIMEREDGKLE